MTHYTHNGAFAGVPYCGIPRSVAKQRGHRFAYLADAQRDEHPDLCERCRKATS